MTADFFKPEYIVMRRNTYRTSSFLLRNSLPLAAIVIALGFTNCFAQSSFTEKPSYSVLSSNSNEVVISVTPNYHIRTVTSGTTGESYERISFSGSSIKGIAIGAPAAEWLPLSVKGRICTDKKPSFCEPTSY